MSSEMTKLAKSLSSIIEESNNNKTTPYDTQATVIRIEGSTAWVHIPGGVNETPVRKTIDASEGDTVQVRVSGGSAWLVGNYSAPPTDDTTANNAMTNAKRAIVVADKASVEAEKAQTSAEIAASAASEAQSSARVANTAANTALTQLSVVEDVAGTLNWISEHGSYVVTTDTTVQNGVVYFIYNESTVDYEPIVSPDPTKNPHAEGWYVLDISDSQSDYIMAHLAVTSRGLWVLPSGMGTAIDEQYAPNYKMLLSSGGVYIYDGSGNLVATYGESIGFSSTRPQYIGNDNAYIVFSPADGGSITIGGANIILDTDQTLDEVLADLSQDVDDSIKIIEYALGTSPTIAPTTGWSTSSPVWESGKYVWMRQSKDGQSYAYTCIQGAKGEDGEDAIQIYIHSSEGTAFKNNEISTTLTVTIYYGSKVITNQQSLIREFGSGTYLQWQVKLYGQSTPTTIPSSDPRLSDDGFTFNISPADVNIQAVFNVQIIVPD